MKNKFNLEVLKEEQKRFRLLSEYDFYTEKKEPVTYSEDDGGKELLLGKELEEADELPDENQTDSNVQSAADSVASDLGVDDQATSQTAPAPEEAPAPEPSPAPLPEPAPEENTDDVELDVTDLVQGSTEAKESADAASRNSEVLLKKLTDLETRIASMTDISDKIEKLENEIIKRNPTPVEKLEMRSLDSYPFNQKLSDYWANKEGIYDVMNQEDKTQEYSLTKNDVNNSFNEFSAKDSFKVTPDMYDEEDMDGYTETDL